MPAQAAAAADGTTEAAGTDVTGEAAKDTKVDTRTKSTADTADAGEKTDVLTEHDDDSDLDALDAHEEPHQDAPHRAPRRSPPAPVPSSPRASASPP